MRTTWVTALIGSENRAYLSGTDWTALVRHVSLATKLRGSDLVLTVKFQEGRPPKGRAGEISLRFEPSVNRYLSLVLDDREKPGVGNGRLVAKIRAVGVPVHPTGRPT